MTNVPEQIRRYLLQGENVVWWGRPQQGIMLMPRDGLLIPFSLLWGGFAIFWEASALRTSAPFPFALFGVPFVLVGLFMMFGRFLLDAKLRRDIAYALTDRRVLIARGGPWPSFKSVTLDRLPDVTLIETGADRGTIRFGTQPAFWGLTNSQGFGSWIGALDPTPQFLGIDDVQRVFAAVQQRTQSGLG